MSIASRHVTVSCAVAISLACVPAVARSQAAPAKQVVVPPGVNASATLSPGILLSDVLFVSGQLGTARDPPDSNIQTQTRRALENVKAVVEAAGSSMSNVVKCTVFLVNVSDFAGLNSVYTQFFTKEPPARSTVAVAALVSPAAKVEIECIAAIPRGG